MASKPRLSARGPAITRENRRPTTYGASRHPLGLERQSPGAGGREAANGPPLRSKGAEEPLRTRCQPVGSGNHPQREPSTLSRQRRTLATTHLTRCR